MAEQAATSLDEVCASCGKFVPYLVDETGWCSDCSPPELTNLVVDRQIEHFLEKNADHIEHYILQGNSFAKAVALLRLDLRPICISCGGVIHRAPRNSVFCRRNRPCRRFSRKYVYLYRERGLSKSEALAKVISEL